MKRSNFLQNQAPRRVIPYISLQDLQSFAVVDETFKISPRTIAHTGIPTEKIKEEYNKQGYDVYWQYFNGKLVYALVTMI